jgi:hypothetical protein
VLLDRGAWRPAFVAMHGDLHTGNFLRREEASRRRLPRWDLPFVVIDWSGAQRDGLPLYDLVRLAHSLRIPPRRLARELARHTAILGGTLGAAPAHLAAAFADLKQNLEHFPIERFARLADVCFARVDAALASTHESAHT